MSVAPSSIIFINSKQRISGTPYDFYVNFNNDLIKCPNGYYMQFTVQQASISRSWYSIQSGYNTFHITSSTPSTTTVTIPEGYYNAIDMRTTLQTLMPSWTVTYSRKINKFSFTRPNDGVTSYTLDMPTTVIADLLGFYIEDTPVFTISNPTIVSHIPIKVNADSSIYIHTNLPRQKMSAYDNINPTIAESDVLCAISIQSAPFDNIVFSRNNGAEFTYNVLSPSIHSMRIYVTNEQGVPLRLPYDWDLTLSIDYIPIEQDKSTSILQDIKDYIKLGLMHHLDSNKN